MKAKQVIVIRKDLKMRRGKECAQAAHAAMAPLLNRKTDYQKYEDGTSQITLPLTKAMDAWLQGHFIKICVTVNSEAELLAIYEKAVAAGLPCALIKDSGFTEFKGVPTYTTVGIGPADSKEIDPITGHLPLY